MRRYARFQEITAWVLGIASAIGLVVLAKRWFWK
jgi:hypothetical protein